MCGIRGWVRLGIVLSGLWIIGIGLYTSYVWHNARDVDSPFVYYVIPTGRPEGGFFRVNRVEKEQWFVPQPRFKTELFLTIFFGVLAGIWVATVGPAWVISAFKEQEGRGESPPATLE